MATRQRHSSSTVAAARQLQPRQGRAPGVPHTVCMALRRASLPACVFLANPKSTILSRLMSPGSTSSRLSSFKSRCTTPLRWEERREAAGGMRRCQTLAPMLGRHLHGAGACSAAQHICAATCLCPTTATHPAHRECRYCTALMSWRNTVRPGCPGLAWSFRWCSWGAWKPAVLPSACPRTHPAAVALHCSSAAASFIGM